MGGEAPPPHIDMSSFGKSGTGFGLSEAPAPKNEEKKAENSEACYSYPQLTSVGVHTDCILWKLTLNHSR